MGEAVVILAPHVRAEQVVERGDRAPPGNAPSHLQPLGVLVEHRVDDVDEGLVAIEEPVPAGEEVALEPALALMLREHFDDPALGGEVLVGRHDLRLPDLLRHLEDVVEPVRRRLVGPEDPEVRWVAGDDVPEKPAEHARGLAEGRAGRQDVDRVVAEVRADEILHQLAAVGVRVRAHPPAAARRQLTELGNEAPFLVEELLGPVAAQPVLEHAEVVGVVADARDRHLVRAPGSLDRQTVDLLGAGPALRRPQDDHRPLRPRFDALLPGRALNLGDLVEGFVEGAGEILVDRVRLVAGDDQRPPAAALEKRDELLLGNPCEHGRIRDLVAVEVKERQDCAVGARVQELVAVPPRRQRAGFGLAVADDAGHDQLGVVEGGAEGVRERVAELAALVDRAGRLGRRMAGDAAGKRELAEEVADPFLVSADMRVELGVGALEPGVCDDGRAAVAGAGDVDRVEVALLDRAVQVDVDQIEAGNGPEVAEQAGLDVLWPERLAEQRVVEQVDLADREVVGGPPVRVD